MTSCDVLIIGAGISGLSAASTLIDNGVTDIIIIEAQNYVGGRTHTIPIDGGYIEFGAQWIHGKENNPLYDKCSSLDLLDEDSKTIFGDMNFATQDGTRVDEEFFDEMTEKINELFERLKEESSELETDKSVGELVGEEFEKLLAEIVDEKGLDDGQVNLLRAIYEARLKEEKNDTACSDLNQLSAMGWNAFEDSAGDSMIITKYGYKALVDHFREKITDEKIHLNEPVTKVNYGNDGVTVTTKDGEYSARFCICTIPLGYLKSNYKSLFEPSFPKEKAKAIEKLGFGLMDKIFLVFDSQPFGDDCQGFQVLWRNDLSFKLNAAKKWSIGNEFYKSFSTFEFWAKNKSVMYTFITGSEGGYAENLSDQCLLEVITELLQTCFPEHNVPAPKKIIRSKWLNNPYTRGAYTHVKMGSSVSDVEALAEPLDSKLFFAGEHTSVEFVSTVHGAYQTGIREAERILEIMNQ